MEQEIKTPPSWLDRPIISVLEKVNVETIVIVLILAVAIISRFYNLGARVMSHDEVNHVVPSYDLFKGLGYRYDPVTHGPLQFHLIALSFFVLGDSDFSARVPYALFNIAAIAVIMLTFKRYIGQKGAIIAGFLFLISPYLLFYGRYARNEGFSPMWVVLTLLATLRYLEKGDKGSLLLLTLVTAFHFIDKATAFIYTAQLMIFLAVIFLQEIVKVRWPNSSSRNWFISLMTLMLTFVAISLGLAVWDAAIKKAAAPADTNAPTPAVTTAVSISPQMLLVIISVGIAVLMGVAAIFVLVNNLGWKAIRRQRSFDLLILLATLVLPQLSAFPVRALGWSPLDYSSIGIAHSAIFIALFSVIAVGLGLWWGGKFWLAMAAVFWSIFTVFYTTFFTNGPGFFTGLVGALGYWLEQQGVQRGSQPWYFYALIQIPIYEYLAAAGCFLALYFGIRYRKFTTIPGFAPAHQPDLPEGNAEAEELPVDDPPAGEEGSLIAQSPMTEGEDTGQRKQPVLALLMYWSILSLIAYTLAGEKMPWLTVHIATPMVLTAGWGLGYLVDKIQWKQILNRRGLLAVILLPIFIASAGGVIASLGGVQLPFQGNTLEQLQATSSFLLAAVALLASSIGMMYTLKDWAFVHVLRLGTLIFFVFLAFLTIRTAYRAAFINYDTALEYLVYAHAARGPKDVLQQVQEISQRTTRGKDIVVAYDNDALYPYWWYLRDYPNHRWFTDKPTRDLQQAPLIIAGEDNYAKLEPIVKDNYVQFDYMRLWWPNQDYFDLTLQRLWYAISNPQMRTAIFDIWFNRDYTLYAQITNNSNLTVEDWQPSARMRFYVRKDVVAEIWNYGAAPTTPQVTQTDPYEKATIKLAPDLSFGSPGNGPAQFQAPRGLAVAPDGTLYVADSRNNRIQHLTPDGQVLQMWGTFADATNGGNAPGGTFNEPWDVAVGPDGSVYVADTWNHRVQKFSADGKFISMWGYFGQAEKPDAFWGPRAVAVDAQGRVFVVDTGNKRVVIFDANGNYLGQFGTAGMDPGQFDEPVGIALGPENKLYIADTWNQRIQVFAQDPTNPNNYLPSKNWDVSAWYGQSLDNKPYIAVDEAGNIFVTDPEGYRVLEFDPGGNIVRAWGDYSTDPSGFSLASGIAIGPQGHVWVSDGGNNRILRFTMPQ
jgi:uncharacterized protein (TIGR03663 family)